VNHSLEMVVGLRDGDQAIGPIGDIACGLHAHGGAQERWRRLGQSPYASAVHGDQTVVADLVAGKQRPDYVNTFAQAGGSDLFAGPPAASDVLIQGLAGP
jgi:hypothetical protein